MQYIRWLIYHLSHHVLVFLKKQAVDKLNSAAEGYVRWANLVRDQKEPYRFYWSAHHLRDADVGSTSYILSGLARAGVLDQVLTKEQKQQGIAWIKSLEVEANSYEDPALLAYKPPMWNDEAETWPPTSGHKEVMDRYARYCLHHYGYGGIDRLQGPPPPDWPQVNEVDKVLDWIKKVEPNWSWISYMIRRLMDWHIAGLIAIDPLIDCLKYVYSKQDLETGFWANGIQTTFKILKWATPTTQ